MVADLLDSVGEIRPGESEVLQASSKTPISSRISHKITQSSRQLRLSVNRSGARLAVSHPGTLQDIQGILALVKEKTSLTGLNCHAHEVVKLAQILHGKLLLK
jgi:hypothetical protein